MQIPIKQKDKNNLSFDKLPTLAYAGRISNDPAWSFTSHKHDDITELLYVLDGEGEFIIDNKLYIAKKGDILIYNQGVLHDEKSSMDNPLSFYFCGIKDVQINGLDEGYIIDKNITPVINANQYKHKVENYIKDIFEECSSQVSGFEILCQSLAVSLIVLIIRVLESGQAYKILAPENSVARQIKDYIDKNYAKEITLNEISGSLYLSQDYLSHIFKDNTGYSPIKYMINRRIGEAKKMLLTTDMTIQEVSTQVGYENANYFSVLFKKVTGMSPKKFKESNLKL